VRGGAHGKARHCLLSGPSAQPCDGKAFTASPSVGSAAVALKERHALGGMRAGAMRPAAKVSGHLWAAGGSTRQGTCNSAGEKGESGRPVSICGRIPGREGWCLRTGTSSLHGLAWTGLAARFLAVLGPVTIGGPYHATVGPDEDKLI